MSGVRIVGLGTALPGVNAPGRVVTNEVLANELRMRREHLIAEGGLTADDPRGVQFETTDEWIRQRTGIARRCEAADGTATSDLGAQAGKMAMAVADWEPRDVQAIIVATTTHDFLASPPTVSEVQRKLGIPSRASVGYRSLDGFDVSCACSSFGKGLKIGYAYVAAGLAERVLVLGADVISRLVGKYDRAVLPILADGGGAVALEATVGPGDFLGSSGFFSGLDGSFGHLIRVTSGGGRDWYGDRGRPRDLLDDSYRVKMDGSSVMKSVVRILLGDGEQDAVIPAALKKAGIGDVKMIDFVALHQANERINRAVEDRLRKLGFTGCVYHNIQNYGNTTSASVPLVLYDAWVGGQLRPGMLVMSAVFGGGMAWEVIFFRWSLPQSEL